ncbi:MAG: ubiquinone/menaquinone biosynthesis methyltransferase [Bdellovibrionales bacterium]|nr:ubiquinone/menaquinone biosynthesis methyltransferase [Bdellovibrionales bacterium]
MRWTPPQPETVQKIFRLISRHYDLANRVLSLGLDQSWRKAAVRHSLRLCPTAKDVLDLATGTGDLAIAFHRKMSQSARITGADFNPEMLLIAREKHSKINWQLADATRLSFQDHSFDLVSISFGLRNVEDPDQAIRELFRVTRPGGCIVILEFGNPGSSICGRVIHRFNRLWLRLMGGALTGAGWAYQYLSRTSESFPGASQLQAHCHTLLPSSSVTTKTLFPGICYLCMIQKNQN